MLMLVNLRNNKNECIFDSEAYNKVNLKGTNGALDKSIILRQSSQRKNITC